MLIESQREGFVGTITLDHSAKRNALSQELIAELLAALDNFQQASVRAVIVRAAPKASVWSAGHDIGDLREGQDPLLSIGPLERLLQAVRHFPAPVIAMVHGSVWGGGTDLVLSCDLVIGDETCSFAITPANLGLAYPAAGLRHYTRRLPLNVVKEMFFTAAPLRAEEAARWGLLNHLVPSAKLEAFTRELAATIATKAPLVVSMIKEQLRIAAEADSTTPEDSARIEALRRQVYESAYYVEGLRAFREKRAPVFRGV